MGTYRGSINENDDLLMFNALVDSIMGGINVIDTCSNFRLGKSEKVIGRSLQYLFEK